ncbi:uncharacterized protein LOC127880528 [Dreissena polymorpha]|uniref:Sushi domain-containing protein n=1 Tax=Dreissena polymorpha TaxID=45954 RepID=A0A9D4JQL5_DREPO|nr:uncharacterized protein LOC127880528 [Dreissena polymorpha]XP_052283805.1 uncharacterized protein LOC127880528 [Dreissena polymorpha]KAH3820731.1 hypothetical protein DPMN_122480 [Dreissena polymorpha]
MNTMLGIRVVILTILCSTTTATATPTTPPTTTTDSQTSSGQNSTTVIMTSVSVTTADHKLTCPEPKPIIGGAIISNGPYYANATKVVFDCFSGYWMSGPSSVLCSPGGTWDLNLTQCVPINNQPYVHTELTIQNESQVLPYWLMIVLCVTFGLLCLLLLACVVALCMKMCGCWQLRCCKTRVLHSRMSWQQTPDEIIVEPPKVTPPMNSKKRKNSAVKPDHVWMPHSHEVRNINTSTK